MPIDEDPACPQGIGGGEEHQDLWWRVNRPAATDLFEQELNASLERIGTTPTLGSLYEGGNLEAPVRRVLLPKTKNHVYFVVEGDEIVVISIWGAPKGRGPKL